MTGFIGVLIGSILWMDRVFMFQFMVSRPMIMGPLVGFVMSDLKIGLLVGLSLELLWLNSPPVGAYLPNDESFCTAVATPVAVIAGAWASPSAAAGLSILLCLPVALVGRSLDTRLRIMNEGLIDPNDQVDGKKVSGAMVRAILRAFILSLAVLCACTFAMGSLAIFIGKCIPPSVLSAISIMPFACVVIGLAALVSREMPRRLHAGIFALGLALALLVTWIL